MDKKQTLTEHNDLITAHYDMSASEQDIFSLVLCQLQEKDPPDQRYCVYVKDIEEITQRKVDYIKVKKSAKKLLTRVCTIIRDNGDPLYVTMISDAEHIRGAGYIEIGISSKIKPYLVDLKTNFTNSLLTYASPMRLKKQDESLLILSLR